jgi:hypothetical protein
MIINPKFKLHETAGEYYVMIQGSTAGDTGHILSLNETSLYLWYALQDRRFELEDVVQLLLDQYLVDEPTAKEDAQTWLQQLKNFGILA